MVEVNIILVKCRNNGKTLSYPPLVPQLVKNLSGVGLSVEMIMRRLDPGQCGTFSQFNTFMSSISAFSTVWEAYVKSLIKGAYVVGYPRKKVVLTKRTTQKVWVEWFLRGVEMWVGRKASTDQAIRTEYIKLLMENMEAYLRVRGPTVENIYLCEKGCLFYVLFCGVNKGGWYIHDVCVRAGVSNQ